MSCIVLQVCLQDVETQLAETSEGLQWTFLFLLPFASFIYPTIYIYILLIRQHTKIVKVTQSPTPGTMTKDPSHRAILLRQRSSKMLIVGINLWNHFHVSGNPAEEPNESADGQAVFEPPVDHGDLEISRSRYHRYILGDLWRRQHLCQRHLPSNQGPETRDHVSCEQHL